METFERAGLVRRLAAFLLDVVGIVFVLALDTFTGFHLMDLGKLLGMVYPLSIDTSADVMAITLQSFWWAAWIYPLFEIATGASPAKRLLGLRVRLADGKRVGIGRRLIRALLKNAVLFGLLPFGMVESWPVICISFSVGLAGLIGFFFVFGSAHRTLQDKISGTAVLRKRSSDQCSTEGARTLKE